MLLQLSRAYRPVAGLAMLLMAPAWADVVSGEGVCRKLPGDPKLPSARCALPECPADKDCDPPTLGTGTVRFGEPYYHWQPDCRPEYRRGCWDAKFVFALRLEARDAGLIRDVGAVLRVRKGDKEELRTVYAPVQGRDSEGFYQVEYHHGERIPADGDVAVSVHEFCARDAAGNAGCAPPRVPLSPELVGQASAPKKR